MGKKGRKSKRNGKSKKKKNLEDEVGSSEERFGRAKSETDLGEEKPPSGGEDSNTIGEIGEERNGRRSNNTLREESRGRLRQYTISDTEQNSKDKIEYSSEESDVMSNCRKYDEVSSPSQEEKANTAYENSKDKIEYSSEESDVMSNCRKYDEVSSPSQEEKANTAYELKTDPTPSGEWSSSERCSSTSKSNDEVGEESYNWSTEELKSKEESSSHSCSSHVTPYQYFCYGELPRLLNEYPGLSLMQYKIKLWDEWCKKEKEEEMLWKFREEELEEERRQEEEEVEGTLIQSIARIHVLYLLDNSRHTVEIPLSCTFGELKKLIEEVCGIPTQGRHLIYNGSYMLDHTTLEFYGVESGDSVSVTRPP